MATAVMEALVPIPQLPYRVILTLSQKEAETLYGICGAIGGKPSGLRGHMDQISRALSKAGVHCPHHKYLPVAKSIYFADT